MRALSAMLSDIHVQLDAYMSEPYLPKECTVEVDHKSVLSAEPVPSHETSRSQSPTPESQ